MATVDLDAARAARQEAAGDPHQVRLGGRDFLLPAEIAFEALEGLIAVADLDADTDAAAALLGTRNLFEALFADQWDDFMALHPSLTDLLVLAGEIPRLYGFDSVGESRASDSSSSGTSRSSRRTSNGSTVSTSASAATVARR